MFYLISIYWFSPSLLSHCPVYSLFVWFWVIWLRDNSRDNISFLVVHYPSFPPFSRDNRCRIVPIVPVIVPDIVPHILKHFYRLKACLFRPHVTTVSVWKVSQMEALAGLAEIYGSCVFRPLVHVPECSFSLAPSSEWFLTCVFTISFHLLLSDRLILYLHWRP